MARSKRARAASSHRLGRRRWNREARAAHARAELHPTFGAGEIAPVGGELFPLLGGPLLAAVAALRPLGFAFGHSLPLAIHFTKATRPPMPATIAKSIPTAGMPTLTATKSAGAPTMHDSTTSNLQNAVR